MNLVPAIGQTQELSGWVTVPDALVCGLPRDAGCPTEVQDGAQALQLSGWGSLWVVIVTSYMTLAKLLNCSMSQCSYFKIEG